MLKITRLLVQYETLLTVIIEVIISGISVQIFQEKSFRLTFTKGKNPVLRTAICKPLTVVK